MQNSVGELTFVTEYSAAMKTTAMVINISASAPKVDVDNRIPLRFYYRIADNLIKQASIYREEKNVVDLYITLLRFSSLMSETIPFHRDYQALLPKEKSNFRKKLLAAIEELESLKPEVHRTNEMNKGHASLDGEQEISFDSGGTSLEWPPVNKQISASTDMNQLYTHPISKPNQVSPYSLPINKQFPKLSLNVPFPKEETRTRHSVLGPTGLQGQWQGPATTGVRVNYPSNAELTSTGVSGQNQVGQYSLVEANDDDSRRKESTVESVLCLNEWSLPNEKSGSPPGSSKWEDSIQMNDIHQLAPPPAVAQVNDIWQHPLRPVVAQVNTIHQHPPSPVVAQVNNIQQHLPPPVHAHLNNIHQPSPPPVLAHINNFQRPSPPPALSHVKDMQPIPPSKVADPMPGPARPPADGIPDSNTFQHLYISPKMMEDFLSIARANTAKNLETCGVLAGSLRNSKFFVTTLIIPKQESTSDSCQTMNEEEIFDLQDKLSLFPLGWIHTHPTQTCFMSSIDLHTHYSYQVMLPEAIAIVMAPTDTTRTFGIFHLSDPAGVSLIRNCQERGFHPHEQPDDGSPIYEHCSHVYMHPKLNFEVVDLRQIND